MTTSWTLQRRRNLRVFWVTIAVVNTILTAISFYWLGAQIEDHLRSHAVEHARSYADVILATRDWNAGSDEAGTHIGEGMFTETHLLWRELEPGQQVTFTFTSNHPIDPANVPDGWEVKALESFESGAEEHLTVFPGRFPILRYATPLVATGDCIVCHQSEGHRLGDVIGMLSLTVPYGTTESALAANRRRLASGAAIRILVMLAIIWGTATWLERRLASAASGLEYLVDTDMLTELSSRHATFITLDRELERAKRSGARLGILMIDIDHFKRFNDTFGHATGDKVLRRTAAMLRDAVRPSDTVGRVGGEELMVIAPGVDSESIADLAERLRVLAEVIDLTDICGDCGGPLTLSIGTAVTFPDMRESADELVERADNAMYTAKNTGRNRVIAG